MSIKPLNLLLFIITISALDSVVVGVVYSVVRLIMYAVGLCRARGWHNRSDYKGKTGSLVCR